jgi:hypothetical protein
VPRCAAPPRAPNDQGAYAYLLGLYLGDGHLVTRAKVPVLRIFCADAWPGLIDECAAAVPAVLAREVQRVQKQGCVGVQSYSKHWPCLLSQHGPGHKHHRPIYLARWQQPIIDHHPHSLLRGLFHSDGCRVTNRIKRGVKTYEIQGTTSPTHQPTSCGSVRNPRTGWHRLAYVSSHMLSVARREAVAQLDTFVGPKW